MEDSKKQNTRSRTDIRGSRRVTGVWEMVKKKQRGI